MTVGNLAAFSQTNLQRLLAYSTIAHAGTMLVGLAALSRDGAAAVLFYLVAYLFANVGAFAAVAFVRNRTGRVDDEGLRGLVYRAPGLAVALIVCLLSLLGMPPLAGFAAKFQVFAAAATAGDAFRAGPAPWLGYTLYGLVAVGLLNTVFGAVYYLRLVRLMLLERPADELPVAVPRSAAAYAAALAVLTLIPGLAWGPVADAGGRAAAPLAVSGKVIP
jgi:NADH-quinone oxidoreductase subunit N